MKTSDFVYKTLYLAGLCPFSSLYNVKTYGRENLPTGRAILVANHSSYLDPFFMIAGIKSKKPMHFCTLDFYKHSESRLGKIQASLANFLLGLTGQIVLEGGAMNRASFKKVKGVLDDDRYLGIFAEGKRSYDGKLDEFRDGAAYLALRTQSPLVPIWLQGCREIWKRGDGFPKLHGDVEIRIGNPIFASPCEKRDLRMRALDITDCLRREVLKLSV
jgi:1-acyl-sn-glycerol-3-phosphate acyltransferase